MFMFSAVLSPPASFRMTRAFCMQCRLPPGRRNSRLQDSFLEHASVFREPTTHALRHSFAAMNHIFQLALANSFNLRSQCREFALGRPSCTVIHILHSSPAGRTWVDMSLQRLSKKKNRHAMAFSDCFLVVWWHRQQRLFLRVQNISRLHLVPKKVRRTHTCKPQRTGRALGQRGNTKERSACERSSLLSCCLACEAAWKSSSGYRSCA